MILANQFGRPTYYFPRPVFQSHTCVYISFSEHKIAHAQNFGSCYAQISTSRCVAFGGVTSCTLVCFPFLLSPGCFVGWAVPVSISCAGVCLTSVLLYVGAFAWILASLLENFLFYFILFFSFFCSIRILGGSTTFSSLPHLLLYTYALHIQSLCVQPACDPRGELCSPT